MADMTAKELRNLVMYQIFVRNFSSEGTFRAVIPELDRIKALGVDIIWFAPIHPIGEAQRKGSLGSPYAIRDYRAVNPEYGTPEDFRALVDAIHARGMRCMIDVVYNHTSPDSVLRFEHPEWFYHRPDGSFGNRVGEWTDIIDLDYAHRELWDYQIETLCQWAELVDGFRCDVAPLIPMEFWTKARQAVERVRPGCLWLSESVDPGFLLAMRDLGLPAQSDGEMYRAFDLCYDYDVFPKLTEYLAGKTTLARYAEAVERQEYIYPDNYGKLRFLENHDQPRARFLFPELRSLRNATAWLFFQKGTTLIYAGQEYALDHRPSLFDRDTVDWDGPEKADLSPLIRALAAIKRDPVFAHSRFTVSAPHPDVLLATHRGREALYLGVFSLKGEPTLVATQDVPEGVYQNLIDGSAVEAAHGFVSVSGEPIILRLDKQEGIK